MKELYDATKRTVSTETYPGYPTQRLSVHDLEDPTVLTLPDGEWSTGDFVYPTQEQQDELRAQGYELDSHGRPLHPWLRYMLSEPEVGVVTGLGEYWKWGPNHTADSVIITAEDTPRILLQQRTDTGTWALPGGFVDEGERASRTAFRESAEEVGVIVTGTPVPVYSGVVADSRTTAHAWAETAALLWRVPEAVTPHISQESLAADWFSLDQLPEQLHGSHAVLIQQALGKLNDAPVGHIASLGEQLARIDQASGGHMGYERSIITTASGREYFLKHHDDTLFTDELKRSRSRLYLQKEKILYDHLTEHTPDVIPREVQLLSNHGLLMQGLTTEQGWRWRAPAEQVDEYIRDVLAQLEQLESVPSLDEPFDYTIKPSYVTYVEEGWQAIDDDTQSKIAARIAEFQHAMRLEFGTASAELVKSLPKLAATATSLQDPQEFSFAHHDLRQANIAWHPQHGAKIVDWSWAGPGRIHSDATTLLIDLHKSGHDIAAYKDYFNPDHALTLIGFWLAHSLYPTPGDDTTVRFQQVVSAVSAYDILAKDW